MTALNGAIVSRPAMISAAVPGLNTGSAPHACASAASGRGPAAGALAGAAAGRVPANPILSRATVCLTGTTRASEVTGARGTAVTSAGSSAIATPGTTRDQMGRTQALSRAFVYRLR